MSWHWVLAAPIVVGLATAVWLVRDRENGILTLIALSHQVRELDDQVRALAAERDALVSEVAALEHDPATIERHARERLGMARDDEVVVRFD